MPNPQSIIPNGRMKFIDMIIRILASISVVVCVGMFTYVLNVEAKMTRFDSFMVGEKEFLAKHREDHLEVNKQMQRLLEMLHNITTDVRVIQGNRFTSKDGQVMMTEITRIWQCVNDLSKDVKSIESKLR